MQIESCKLKERLDSELKSAQSLLDRPRKNGGVDPEFLPWLRGYRKALLIVMGDVSDLEAEERVGNE